MKIERLGGVSFFVEFILVEWGRTAECETNRPESSTILRKKKEREREEVTIITPSEKRETRRLSYYKSTYDC